MMMVREIMTPDPITLGPEDTLIDAGALMKEHRIRHIPIVNEEMVLLGLVTQRDLLVAVSSDESTYSTGDIMRRKVYKIPAESDMRSAALIMQKYKIGSVPVVHNDKLIGIVTDSDYVSLSINLLEQLEEREPLEADDFDEIPEINEFSNGGENT